MKSRLNFSGHQTFTLRHGWIPKAVELIEQHPALLIGEGAMLELGVGKNMVDSIRYWIQATGVATKDGGTFKLTALGTLLFGKDGADRFLEDPATLWLLHWQLASNEEKSSTWFWLFNTLKQTDFKEEALAKGLEDWIKQENIRQESETPVPAPETLERDIDCCLRTYLTPKRKKDKVDTEDTLDCPLIELDLVLDLDEIDNRKWYRFNTEAHKQLPDWVFAYTVADFWSRLNAKRETLSFEDLAFKNGSPGNVFKMNPDALLDRIERLTEGKLFGFEESSGVRNVILKTPSVLSEPTSVIKEMLVDAR